MLRHTLPDTAKNYLGGSGSIRLPIAMPARAAA